VTQQTTRLVFPSRIEAVADAAVAAADFVQHSGAGEEAAFGVDLAVREAVTNAVVHGNQEDLTKEVEVTFGSSPGTLEIEVKDQGEGFDPASVPDPTDPANLMKASGRGMFLIRSFMDEAQWFTAPEGGTIVRMVKHF
jgi:serine/threonine-protein kinase RsbW